MAKRLTSCRRAARWLNRPLAAGPALLLLASWALSGVAATLRDPTAPPQVRHRSAGVAAAGHLPALESVLLLPGYKAAIIDGQTVMLGSMFKGARLIAITAKTARLRKGARVQVLHLAPEAVSEVEAAPAAAAMEKTN